MEPKEILRQAMGKRADWNMILFDFQRYSELIGEGAKLAVMVRRGNFEFCKDLYAIEAELIDEWHGVMLNVRSDLAGKFEQLERKARSVAHNVIETPRGKQVNILAPKLVLELWRELHDFKQLAERGVKESPCVFG